MNHAKCKCGCSVSASPSVAAIKCRSCKAVVQFRPDNKKGKDILARRKDTDAKMAICESNQCGQFGWHRVRDKQAKGCGLLLEKTGKPPCQTREHIHFGNGCPADPPQFLPREVPCQVAPYVTYEQLRRDVASFAATVAAMPEITAIAGVPRSGMIVAAELAVRLGLPLYAVDDGGLTGLTPGTRLRELETYKGQGYVLVMEDSVATGRSIREARQQLNYGPHACKYGCIYGASSSLDLVDVCHRRVELPHQFEWNFFGNSYLLNHSQTGMDFDGIFGLDCPREDDDDGDRYRKWMRNLRPILTPRPISIPYIITARLERYRELTQEWLDRHDIRCQHLIMGPWRDNAERAKACVGTWKAGQIEAHGVKLYVESDPQQARVISTAVQVPVICPAMETSLVGGLGWWDWHERWST